MKLIQYANGITELRTYSEPVGNKPSAISDEEMVIRQMMGREQNKLKTHTVYNPFSEQDEELYDTDDIEEIERRKRHSERNSYSRTVQEIYKVSRQCEWKYFITLTYDGTKIDRYDFGECMKKANKWFHNQRRLAPDLQYLFVPEEHKDGAWHIHGLVAQCGGMKFSDSGHEYSGRKVYNLDGWKFGFSTAVEVVDVHAISGYITKYITKDLCAKTKGKRRYYRSQNIPEPIEHEFLIAGNEKESYAQMLVDSLGLDMEYQKAIEGYVSVDYKYFKQKGKEENE